MVHIFTASALLHFIKNSENIKEIVLRFSIPGPGQNEGDSAHSAISYALKKSGDIFFPSQIFIAKAIIPYSQGEELGTYVE